MHNGPTLCINQSDFRTKIQLDSANQKPPCRLHVNKQPVKVLQIAFLSRISRFLRNFPHQIILRSRLTRKVCVCKTFYRRTWTADSNFFFVLWEYLSVSFTLEFFKKECKNFCHLYSFTRYETKWQQCDENISKIISEQEETMATKNSHIPQLLCFASVWQISFMPQSCPKSFQTKV